MSWRVRGCGITDHYEVLGVARGASRDQIRRAYLRLARQHHPDHAEGAATTSPRIVAINEAWRVLSNQALRRDYDRRLQDATRGTPGERLAADGFVSTADWAKWEAELDGDERSGDGIEGTFVHHALRVMPFVVLLLLLVAIFVFSAVARNTDDPVIRQAPVAGSCLFIDDSGFRPTPCTAPNNGTIVETVTRGAVCADPAATRYDPPEGSTSFCLVPNLDSR